MKYSPTTINQDQLDVLAAPYLGGEWNVSFSHQPSLRVGRLILSAPGTGDYTKNLAVAIPAGGKDLQVIASGPIVSDSPMVVTFACKDNSEPPATMAATATFSPALWADDQTANFQRGYAMDLVPATAGKKITEVTGLTSVTNGSANVRLDVYILPEAADFFQAACASGVRFSTRERQPVGIDCQMEADAYIKRGKSKKGEFSARFKFKGFGDSIARFLGQKGTIMLEGIKDGVLLGDRVVFTEATLGSDHDAPEGDGEHIIDVTGKYVECGMFVAPYSPN